MEIISTLGILMLFSVTIFLGYIGSLIFGRTKIPDVVWLMLLGLLVSYFGLVNRNIFLSMSSLLAALALLIILFEAGLNMNFYQTLRGFPRSMVLAVLGMLLSMGFVGAVSVLYFRLDILSGLLLGAILGGTSSPIVLSVMSRLKIRENIKTLINLESVLTDPLCIIVSIMLMQMIVASASYSLAMQGIASAFSVGAMLGFVAGVIWLFVLEKVKGRPFDQMLTLAFLFLVYVFVESLAGSGAISSLVFGIVLGNGKVFSKILKLGKSFSIDESMRKFQAEISFFVRSFFFVYIGLIAVISQTFILYGLAIAAVLILARLALVEIGTFRINIEKSEKNIMKIMAPRGLAAAVLAQLPAVYGIKNAEFFSNVIFIVIIATVIYSSIAVMFFYKPAKDNNNEKPEKFAKIAGKEKTARPALNSFEKN